MSHTIYIEDVILGHPRTKKIASHYPQATRISCDRYSEVFNPKAQNFRLQKQQPSLILAKKHQGFVLPAPAGYGIGSPHNYYFSHMLNCVYDCRYCFLQGMYQSANYVVFINYEDFLQEIRNISARHGHEPVHFFSGYDGDSLALEPVTGFADYFLTHVGNIPNAWLELRSKSTQIRSLLKRNPIPRCIVAFSLSPESIAEKQEHKAPPLQRRLQAIEKLQAQGWKIGLRFDPLLYEDNYPSHYRQLFEQVFAIINPDQLHSVSLGVFRLPDTYFKKLHRLYPEDRLFAAPVQTKNGLTAYHESIEQDMMQFCSEQILSYISADKFFPCKA